jgi:hypothetical protein
MINYLVKLVNKRWSESGLEPQCFYWLYIVFLSSHLSGYGYFAPKLSRFIYHVHFRSIVPLVTMYTFCLSSTSASVVFLLTIFAAFGVFGWAGIFFGGRGSVGGARQGTRDSGVEKPLVASALRDPHLAGVPVCRCGHLFLNWR